MRISDIIQGDSLITNPSGHAPLTARLLLQTDSLVTLSLRVLGKHGPRSDLNWSSISADTSFDVPVLGLYPGHANEVRVTLHDRVGVILDTITYRIETPDLPDFFPQIDIEAIDIGKMIPGMTLVSFFRGQHGVQPQSPFIFDAFGEIRWYLDIQGHPVLGGLFYDVGIERLANGHFYFGDGHTDRIYEMNIYGEIINSWDMPGFQFHHNVQEKPNGNFLVTVNKNGIGTVEDHIIEIDRQANLIVNVWDLRESMQYDRRTLVNNNTDWIHVNAVQYDETDGTIIISGRHQCLAKLTEDNQVVWILGIHNGWTVNGRGEDLNQFLLQPLDRSGDPINNVGVLEGYTVHPDFEWNWYQHAHLLMEDGHIMLFDNGENRNFTGGPRYSRAVEYKIDDEAGTVRQAWSYGKDRGEETFSRIVSDVDYYPMEDRVIFSPGASRKNNVPTGKVVEIDRATGRVIFEANIVAPNAPYGIVFHRTERIELYR